MTAVASEDIPESLKEAEKLLNKHAAIKDEIDGYEENYGKMKEQGDRITEGQTDTQYMFLKQVSVRAPPSPLPLSLSISPYLSLNVLHRKSHTI